MLAMAFISYAQNVNIPDTNFKNALISAGVDTNEDGEISYAECEAIKKLDVSQKNISDMTGIEAFVNLDTLYCWENQLTSLDVSNNKDLSNLYLSDMPDLYKVCVWEMPFPPSGTSVDTSNSPNLYFTTDCTSTALNDKVKTRINIYPNPAKEYIVFDITNISSSAKVELFDLQGKKVLEEKLSENKQISISNLPKGLYLFKVKDSRNIYKGKIAVE